MGLVKAYNGDKPYIFVSYSHKDTDIILQMVSQMQCDGYRVWYDEGIEPGTDWDDYIASKINKCSYFIAFLSENYLNSSNCKDEMNYARDHVENILLVYLEPVSLSSGMEMRFGRTQAILAYNYEVKNDFFNKLYISKDLGLCKGDEVAGIVEGAEVVDAVEEPLSSKDLNEKYYESFAETYKVGEVAEIAELAEEPLSSVEETIAEPEPEINAVRVPDRRLKIKKRNLMWIITAASVLVITLVIVGIILFSNDKDNDKKSDSSKDTRIEQDVDEDQDEDEDEDERQDADESVSSNTSEPQGVYSSYGLSVGGNVILKNDMDFYNNSGTPTFYDVNTDDFTEGVFTDTPSIYIIFPVLVEYREPFHVKWYYEEEGKDERLVAEFSDIYPDSEEGVNWYDLILSKTDLGGEIPAGEYYAVIFAGNNEEESAVIKVSYRSSN